MAQVVSKGISDELQLYSKDDRAMSDKPLEITRGNAGIYAIGELRAETHCHSDSPNCVIVITEEYAREFAVTLLRKECIRLRQNCVNWDPFTGTESPLLIAQALEAKIERYLETGEWSE